MEVSELQTLHQLQENCINNQQQHLKNVSSLSRSLLQIQNQKNQILQQIQKEMYESDKILQDSHELSQEITKIPDQKVETTASNASALLHYVERIQDLIFKVTEQCNKKDNLLLTKQEFALLILGINDIIIEAISSNTITESTQGRILRQQDVLNALFSLH